MRRGSVFRTIGGLRAPKEALDIAILSLLVLVLCRNVLFREGIFLTGTDAPAILVLSSLPIRHGWEWLLSNWWPYYSLGHLSEWASPLSYLLTFLSWMVGAQLVYRLYVLAIPLVAALGMYLFSSRLVGSRAAGYASALVYLFNPRFLINLFVGHHYLLNLYAVCPLLFLLWDRVARSDDLRVCLAAGVLTSVFVITNNNAYALI
ncbi:TPA: hypothetical protein EYP44_04815, partial [Candidatus Bathyarchaeota archaeon]|nr:hypothetical protein [Candidatus Bathyarchaeota archaeon]